MWVTGYYVGFDSQGYPVSSVDFAAMTHVVVGPVAPNTSFSLGNAGPAWATSASAAAHEAGDKVLLWVGGSGSEPGLIGATASGNLATFVANLTSAMATYDADGVDIDWEPLATADEPAFTALLTALRSAAPSAILTMPIGTLNMNTDSVDPFYADVAPLVDQENLMSYGMAGAWQGWQSWHSSPLAGESPTTPESIESSVQAYLKAGLPAAKLGLGIGFFGLCYTLPVTAPMQDLGASTIAASDGVMSYANIMSSYYSASAAMWNSTALVPYLSFSAGTGAEGCSYIIVRRRAVRRLEGRLRQGERPRRHHHLGDRRGVHGRQRRQRPDGSRSLGLPAVGCLVPRQGGRVRGPGGGLPPSRRVDPATRMGLPPARRVDPEARRPPPPVRKADPEARRATPASRRAVPAARRGLPPARKVELRLVNGQPWALTAGPGKGDAGGVTEGQDFEAVIAQLRPAAEAARAQWRRRMARAIVWAGVTAAAVGLGLGLLIARQVRLHPAPRPWAQTPR